MACIIPLILSTMGNIPNKLHVSLELLNLRPGLYILMQEAVVINTCHIVKVFGRIANKKVVIPVLF